MSAPGSLNFAAGNARRRTLPAATGGTPSYTYSLTRSGNRPLDFGLSFTPDTRVLSANVTGSDQWGDVNPEQCAGNVPCLRTTHSYKVTDSAAAPASVEREIQITIRDYPTDFLPAGDLKFTRNTAINPVTLSPPPDGWTYTYALTGLPAGLTFDPGRRILSGTPTVEGSTTVTYTATESSVTHTATFTITTAAALVLPMQDDLVYAAGETVTLTLPAATGGTLPLTYAVTGLPAGLSFDPASRILSGTPTTVGVTTLTYTVTDSAAPPARFTLLFDVTVTEPISVAEVEDRTFAAGATVDLTLPEVAGGSPPHIYALTGPDGADVSEAVPGLTFDPATRVLSGTPTEEGVTTLTYTVTDNATTPGRVTRSFIVTVTGPMFTAEVADQTWPLDRAIAPLTLPTATGAGTVTYALTGPDGADVSAAVPGLTFDPATRVLSGTPTEEGITTLTYTATDVYGNDTPMTFVVTVTGVIPAALNEILLPEVVRAMADSTVGAIARRMGQVARGSEAAGFSLGGQGGWAAAVRTHGEAVSEGRRDFRELLSGSDFVLNAAGASGASRVTLWGSGEYRGLSGRSGTLDWDGELAGVHLGVDARLRPDLLAGVAVSRLESDLDYEDATADEGLGTGAHAVELTGVHPYLGWSAWEGLDVWVTAGYGEGELGVTPTGRERRSSEVETRTVGVGGSGLLLERGVSTVRLKGEVMHSVLGVDDSTYIEGLEVEAIRVRMTVAAGQTRVLAGGGVMEPSLEVGVRHDGGDGETGSGAEVGGGLSCRHPAWRITAGGRVRALVGHGGDQEEWGIEGHLGVSPGAGGQGLSLSLRPGYGDSGGGIRELWRQGVTGAGDRGAGDYRGRLEARLGYGLFLSGYAGVFTPYTGMTVGATDGYRIGVNWKAGSRFDLDLLGERREPGGGPAEHALLLKGEVSFQGGVLNERLIPFPVDGKATEARGVPFGPGP